VKEQRSSNYEIGITKFQQRSSNNEVPEPLRATFEMPPAELGDKISNDFDFLRKKH
jgi:hypothetical protein